MEMESILGRLLNQDGISQTNELRTLEELGIQSLDVAYKDVNKNLGNATLWLNKAATPKKTAQTGNLLLAANQCVVSVQLERKLCCSSITTSAVSKI